MSSTSALSTLTSPLRNLSAAMAAMAGVSAKTPLYILTPLGTPSTATLSSTTSTMSRAVPSPPTKTMRGTLPTASPAHLLVSSADVGPSCGAHPMTSRRPPSPASLASASPIWPGGARTLMSGLSDLRNSTALPGATGLAPSWRALR